MGWPIKLSRCPRCRAFTSCSDKSDLSRNRLVVSRSACARGIPEIGAGAAVACSADCLAVGEPASGGKSALYEFDGSPSRAVARGEASPRKRGGESIPHHHLSEPSVNRGGGGLANPAPASVLLATNSCTLIPMHGTVPKMIHLLSRPCADCGNQGFHLGFWLAF